MKYLLACLFIATSSTLVLGEQAAPTKPPSQQAVADVLRKMEAKLSELESRTSKLEKNKQQKQKPTVKPPIAKRTKAGKTVTRPDPTPKPPPIADPSGKVILRARYLEMVGGFRVGFNRIGSQTMAFSTGSLDLLPGTKQWIFDHGADDYLIELLETEPMGKVGTPSEDWPLLKPARRQKALRHINNAKPMGVRWIDKDNIITSGRITYRGKCNPEFVSLVNMNDGKEKRLAIGSGTGCGNMLRYGGGFTRVPKQWADKYLGGRTIALAAGGYDVLGSPFGPAMAGYRIGEPKVKALIDHSVSHPENRDSAYLYPTKSKLPIWKLPNGFTGYWQGSECSHGAAWIDHPRVKGVVWLGAQARGYLTYNSQGDVGGGREFSVNDPVKFFTHLGAGNMRGHSDLFWFADGPRGVIGRTLHVYDPDQIAEVAMGQRAAWNCDQVYDEVPLPGISYSNFSWVLGTTWDVDRQLLWIAVVAPSLPDTDNTAIIMAAYKINVDDSRPDPPMRLPRNWVLDNRGQLVHKLDLLPYEGRGETRNKMTCKTDPGGKVELSWKPTKLSSHSHFQVVRSLRKTGGYKTIANNLHETEFVDETARIGTRYYYMVLDKVTGGKTHDVRGKVSCTPGQN